MPKKIRTMKFRVLCLFAILWGGCTFREESKSNKTESTLLTWIRNQEEHINIELINRIIQEKLNNPFDTNWIQKGFVVTEHDRTVLGELARKVKDENECYYVEYLFTPVLSEAKIIRIGQEQSDSCKGITVPLKDHGDTTKYFIVQNLPN